MEMPPGPEKFDLILCRNVMIYFDRISRGEAYKAAGTLPESGQLPSGGPCRLLSRRETRLEAVFQLYIKSLSKRMRDRGGLYG